MFLHETEVVKAADEQTTAVCSQVKVHIFAEIPVEVILYVLSQVYVKEDEIVHMAPREWGLQALRTQLAAPFLYAQDCIVGNFWCCFNVLQNTLQGHILTGDCCFHRLAGLLLDTVNVPHDTRVVHHNNEWPDTLAFNSQLFEAVPLQFQVVI